MWPSQIDATLGKLKWECEKAGIDYAVILAGENGSEVTTNTEFKYPRDIEKHIPFVVESIRG